MQYPVLIYCASGNKRFHEIAASYGFRYGARLPGTVYGKLYFADQDFKKPDRRKYMQALAKHRPYMATVLDLEYANQLDEVLDWAEEASYYVEQVIIIPKVWNIIQHLPRAINNKQVVLGYSVPTKYGATHVFPLEFQGWPVHLLGGSPHKQMELYRYFDNVVSVDGNMINLMAVRFCQFWAPGNAHYASNRYWPKIKEADGKCWGDGTKSANAPYEAFRRSCENIVKRWNEK